MACRRDVALSRSIRQVRAAVYGGPFVSPGGQVLSRLNGSGARPSFRPAKAERLMIHVHHDASEGATRLADLLGRCSDVVVFTGAGLSTECGVPDFRSPGSPWLANKPIDYSDFIASAEMRAEAWRRKFRMDDLYAGVKPGRGHAAIVALREAGKLSAVITQNIDNLHQASGLDDSVLIELHGNGSYARCVGCGGRHELAPIREAFEASGLAPDCSCGAPVKSATISFGQAMPQHAMRRARDATLDCDLFLVLGSSLVVYPAAAFPQLAKDNGAALAILNREPTPLDGIADLAIRGDIGDVLTLALERAGLAQDAPSTSATRFGL